MPSHSLIDDVALRLSGYYDRGPILFTNPQIRRMIRLTDPKEDDVFFDLGCGWGQNLIIAATEFGLNCVGIENSRPRYTTAKERVEHWVAQGRLTPDRITLKLESLQDVIEDGSIKAAKIIFYGLETESGDIRSLRKKVRSGTKLVYYLLCLFPETLPFDRDYPFYVSRAPCGGTEMSMGRLGSFRFIWDPKGSCGII